RLGRHVALKFLPVELVATGGSMARFRREARAISVLNHPNICTLHDIGDHNDRPFIVMELLEGQTLGRRLADSSLERNTLTEYALQVASGLAAAHEKNIIHRDIKPANVFLTETGQVKVLDFGLAKLVAQPLHHETPAILDEPDAGALTAPGMGVGTPYYMSPEQLQDKQLDVRTDIFSFGVLLYEMATFTLPFTGSDLRAVLHAILTVDPVSPRQLRPEIPQLLEQIIQKALEKEREHRYSSMGEVIVDLNRLKHNDSSNSSKTVVSSPSSLPSIAVLPFVNMSSDSENEYFSDGLAEELTNALIQLQGLQVAARSSAFSFRGEGHSIAEIGRQLHVTSILQGSVRKAGERLRITAQLINAADGYHIWSERYDREMEDIFDLQDEITRRIVNKLKVDLVVDSKEMLVKRYTENVEAYNLYLKGRYHLSQRSEESVVKAIESFELAAAEDPLYALPHAGLGEAYILLNIDCPRIFCDRNPEEMISKAKKSAHRAIELDNSSAEAHVALALVYYRLDWAWEKAEVEFRRALELNEGLAIAHHQYAMFLASIRRYDEALTEIRRAHELDPLSPIISTAVGRILQFAGRYDEAIDQGKRTLELHSQFTGAYFDLGLAYIQKDMYPEASAILRKLGELPGGRKGEMMEMAVVHSRMGQKEKAT
ncbi:MAG: protein kinase, partial [Acidobacteriota bacterium]